MAEDILETLRRIVEPAKSELATAAERVILVEARDRLSALHADIEKALAYLSERIGDEPEDLPEGVTQDGGRTLTTKPAIAEVWKFSNGEYGHVTTMNPPTAVAVDENGRTIGNTNGFRFSIGNSVLDLPHPLYRIH